MVKESPLSKAIRDVKTEIKTIKDEAKSTIEEIRNIVRETLPRPLRRTLRMRIESWRGEKWEN